MKVDFSSLSKKNELKTYLKLGLGRSHKSRRERRKVEQGRLYLFIGGDVPERPWLKVLRREYDAYWDRVFERKVKEMGIVGGEWDERVLDMLRRRVETEVYEEMVAREVQLVELRASFRKEHGRGMTPDEEGSYARALAHGKEERATVRKGWADRETTKRKAVFRAIIERVRSCHQNEPERLQQAWASVVGAEVARDVLLEKVDAESGVAVCRCLSSTLAYQLRRRRELPERLSKELGMNIRRLIFR